MGRFRVVYTLAATDETATTLRSRLETLGEAVEVSEQGGVWSCRLHTDRVGPAIEAGIEAGRPYDIRVVDLTDGAPQLRPAPVARIELRPEAAAAPVGVVAVAAGPGLVERFRQLGVQGVVQAPSADGRLPSVDDLLAVVESVPASEVVVLPNDPRLVPVAEQLDLHTYKRVAVVPTRSVPQGLAALLGYSYLDRDVVEAVEEMAAAASAVDTGEVSRAERDAIVGFGRVRRGDWLGIADDTIVVADRDLEAALRGLVAALLVPGARSLTVYTGDGSQPSVTKALEAWLSELHPGLEVTTVAGGQPSAPYLVSLE